ncbi:MAG: PDZ domain-containing protein [Pirellulaceae bacterium]
MQVSKSRFFEMASSCLFKWEASSLSRLVRNQPFVKNATAWCAGFLVCFLLLFVRNISAQETPRLVPAQNENSSQTSLQEIIAAATENAAKAMVLLEDSIQAGNNSSGRQRFSGMVIHEAGWIVTASANFPSTRTQLAARLPSGERLLARVHGHDHSLNLTLLKIDGVEFSPIESVSEQSIVVGQTAIAVGRNHSHNNVNLSLGIISAIDRFSGRAIQTDANVGWQNYGGALVDLKGRCYGVLLPLGDFSATDLKSGTEWYDSGIGFAIPLELILKRLENWIKHKNTYPGLTGIAFDNAEQYSGTPLVRAVSPGSPAAKSGLERGDIIESANNLKLKSNIDFQFAMGRKLSGESVELVVRKDESNETKTISLNLVEKLPDYRFAMLGVCVDSKMQVRLTITGTAAAKVNVPQGAIITEIDGRKVSSPKELELEIAQHLPGDSVEITWSIDGNIEKRSLELGEFHTELDSGSSSKGNTESTISEINDAEFENKLYLIKPSRTASDQESPLLIWLTAKSVDAPTRSAQLQQQFSELTIHGIAVLVIESSRPETPWELMDRAVIHRALQHVETKLKIDRRCVIAGDQGTSSVCLATALNDTRIRGVAFVDDHFTNEFTKVQISPDQRITALIADNVNNAAALKLTMWRVPFAIAPIGNDDTRYSLLAGWIEFIDRM